MLKDANSMDSTDTGLYAVGVQIDKNAAALNQERAKLSADIDAYNKKCAGQSATSECTNEYNRLVKWQNDLQKKIAAHNKYVEGWRGRVKTFKSVVDNWIGVLTGWEQAIVDFINKAESFFYGATGNCGAQQHAALQQAVNDACKVPNEPYACRQWNPNDPAKDCSKWGRLRKRKKSYAKPPGSNVVLQSCSHVDIGYTLTPRQGSARIASD